MGLRASSKSDCDQLRSTSLQCANLFFDCSILVDFASLFSSLSLSLFGFEVTLSLNSKSENKIKYGKTSFCHIAVF